MEVAALAEHPEEVGGVKVVEGGGDQPAPDLQKQRGIRERLTLTLTLALAAIQAFGTWPSAHHVALVHLWIHGQLHDEPGGVPQDKGGDEVPVDDVPQTADAPVRPETDWLYWPRGDRWAGYTGLERRDKLVKLWLNY